MKKLYNPDSDDNNITLLDGDTTNILNLANIKHENYIKYFDVAYSNNWRPEKIVNIEVDKIQYETVLTEDEREAYEILLSFLIFLDSIQTNNLPNIADRITTPEIIFFLARQTFDEALHSYSYGYLLRNMMTQERFNEIIYKWKVVPMLRERNDHIVKLYEDNVGKNDNRSFLILAIANYLLEGVYFYTAFMFFHNLASRNLMLASNVDISYIKRDELVHCAAFADIIKLFKEEHPEDYDSQLVYDLFEDAVVKDMEFTKAVIGDKILGMSTATIEDYTYYNANKRLELIGENKMFPERENPYKHLDAIASVEDEQTNKVNSFEATSISYKSPETIRGWKELKSTTYTFEADEMLA